ncbi:MAG: DciA family protein [Cytophagales bacterium]|nr:DUF721 domain-containing protein [Bernardetiaceae bacterium]MDW8211171.1 DciA family protein [Cytophagales bacterium]
MHKFDSTRRSEVLPLQEVISQMMNAYGLSEKYEAVQIVNAFRKLLPHTWKNYIENISVYKNCLVIKVAFPSLRAEIAMQRDDLLKQLKKIDSRAARIEEIVVR